MNNAFLSHVILSPDFSRQMDWKKFYPETFVYSPANAFTFAAAGTQSQSFTVDADASFLLTEIAGLAITAALTNVPGGSESFVDATVQIFDSGAGKTLFSAPQQFNNLFGQGGRDRFVLPVPRIIQNNASLVVTITNTNALAVTFALSFIGAKILSR